MLLLVNPLAVALEVDLGCRSGLAVQVDGLVLDNVGLLRLHQEHGERLRRVRGEGFRQVAEADEVIVDCGGTAEGKRVSGRCEKTKVKEEQRKPEKGREGQWKDGGLGGGGKRSGDSGTAYYDRNLCTGLSVRSAHSKTPII